MIWTFAVRSPEDTGTFSRWSGPHINYKHIYIDLCNTRCYKIFKYAYHLSQYVRKRTLWHVRSLKTQISLRIRAVWSESLLSAWRNFTSLAVRNPPSEDSDQSAQMRRLIWIFAGRTCTRVRFLVVRLIFRLNGHLTINICLLQVIYLLHCTWLIYGVLFLSHLFKQGTI